MTNCFSRRGAMLWVLVLATGIAACAGKEKPSYIDVEQQAFDDLRFEIREVIDDPFREMEALSLTNELIESFYQLRTRVTERRRRVMELHVDYDTTREEFEAFFDEIEVDIQVDRIEVIESERELLALLTPDEREALEKVESKAMSAAIKTIQSL